MRERREFFPALTSLRFVAAFLVLFSHVLPLWLPPGALPAGFAKVLVTGTLAVPFFFTLSGFLLFRFDSSDSARWFYWKRFTKIAPLFYLSLGMDAITFAARPAPLSVARALAVNAAFLGACFPKWLFLNPPGWSLSAEAFFYLLFPLLAFVVRKLSRWLVWPALALNFIAGAALAHGAEGSQLTIFDFFFANPLAHLGEFTCGVLLARAYRESGPPALLVAAGAAGLCALVLLVDVTGETPLRGYAGTPFFCALIWGACRSKKGPLHAAWLIALGEASYALYALHWPLLEGILLLLPRGRFPEGAMGGAISAAVLVGFPLLGLLLFRGFEVPVRAALLGIKKASRP